MEAKRKAVLTCYYRPKPGGLCKRLFKGIGALLTRNVEVHYLAVEEFPITHPNLYFHRLWWPFKNTDTILFWSYLHVTAPFVLLYLAIKYKVVRLFAFGSNYGFLLQLARLLYKKPLIVFLRADTIKNHKLKDMPKFIIVLDTLIEGLGIYGTYLYGVSRNTLESVCYRHKHLLPKTKGVLYNNIELSEEIRHFDQVSNFRLASVGVLEERKNIEFFIKCISEINNPKLVVNIFGDGPEKRNLANLVNKLELSGVVKFMGWVDENIIWKNVDVLILPSRHEGLSNALLEAISNGIPVLASNIPEHREVLDQENLFDIDTCEDLNNIIGQLCKRPVETVSEIKKRQDESTSKLIFDWDESFYACIIN